MTMTHSSLFSFIFLLKPEHSICYNIIILLALTFNIKVRCSQLLQLSFFIMHTKEQLQSWALVISKQSYFLNFLLSEFDWG